LKLTQPQKLLLYIIRKGPEYCAETYKPGKRLVELGLAERKEWGELVATAAGHAWREE